VKTINTLNEMLSYSETIKNENKKIAQIDVVGDLHLAHLELIKEAKDKSDVVIVNIDGTTDYVVDKELTAEEKEIYQKTLLSKDILFCRDAGVDALCYYSDRDFWGFHDTSNATEAFKYFISKYHQSYLMSIWPKQLEACKADITVIGQKDYYPDVIIKYFINELNLPTEIIVLPTIRDENGLPVSSRNKFLTNGQKKRASYICREAQKISEWSSYPSVEEIKKHIKNIISNARMFFITGNIYSSTTLEKLTTINEEAFIKLIFKFKDVYITDNIILQPK
jgi:pantoate--beta-alanine ligase|tara:strand:- start:262 stop:1101 length:840 start_codon:yes stop_codon:yes gene_type:complete